LRQSIQTWSGKIWLVEQMSYLSHLLSRARKDLGK
jgi:hypothetical protein